MNISGFEINQAYPTEFCRNAYCSAVIPLCFAGITSNCSRNRSNLAWHHFSLGEHVCSNCIEFLNDNSTKTRTVPTDSVWRHRMSAWRREWLKRSSQHGRRRIPTSAHFLAAQLLPWWLKCNKCGQWRQLPPQTPIGSLEFGGRPDKFTCANVVKMSDEPCCWIVDERATIVCEKPQDFLASMQTHAWLQASPALNILSSYGVDLAGLSPDPLPGANLIEEKSCEKQNPFKVFEENSALSPVDIHSWERLVFTEMTRFPTLYLAVRNLIICLWFENPKILLTKQYVYNRCFVRGLLRIVICEYWIPHLIDELTCRGLINIGVCKPHFDRPLSLSKDSKELFSMRSSDSFSSLNSQYRFRIIGQLNLTCIIFIRQLWNTLVTHYLNQSFSESISNLNHLFSIKLLSNSNLESNPIINSNKNKSTLDKIIYRSNSSLGDIEIRFNCETAERTHYSHDTNSLNEKDDSKLSFINNSLKTLHIPAKAMVLNSDNELSRLFVPLHAWSDRVYTHANHPVSILAWQANLSLDPLPKCVLLQSSLDTVHPNHESGCIQTITPSLSSRIEFHVEAVLDLVNQRYANQLTNFEHISFTLDNEDHVVDDIQTKHKSYSIEECWDKMDRKLRKRLVDLTGDQVEKNLIEYYLASIEYDLTEPLTTNCSSHNSMDFNDNNLTRLDQLDKDLFMQNSIHTKHSPWDLTDENQSNYETCIVHRKPNRFIQNNSVIQHLFEQLLLDNETFMNDYHKSDYEIKFIVVENDLICVENLDTEEDLNDCISMKSPIHNNKNHVEIKLDNISKSKHICIKFMNGSQEYVDWVVVTNPIDEIRLCFGSELMDKVENDFQTFVNSSSKHSASSIYLPSSLYDKLTEPSMEQDQKMDYLMLGNSSITSCQTCPRLITITLIYSSPWWRNCLQQIGKKPNNSTEELLSENSQITSNLVNNTELFAFLPETRENRGFCHTFRDLCPDLISPGILQTELFAAAADHWWSKSDFILETTVDQYLRNNFLHCPDKQEFENSKLLNSYIARLESSLNVVHNFPLIMNIKDEQQPVRLKPTAWIDLAKLTGILIPALMPGHQNKSQDFNNYTDSNKNVNFCPSQSGTNRSISDFIYTENPLRFNGMDALSSAIQSGLELADIVLHILPIDKQTIFKNDNNNENNDQTNLVNNNLLTSTKCSNFSTENSHSYDDSLLLSARNRRLLKRKYIETDPDSPSTTSSTIDTPTSTTT